MLFRRLARCAIGALVMMAIAARAFSAPPPIVHDQPPTLRGAPPAAPFTAPPAAPPAARAEPARFAGMLAAHNRARRAVGVPDLQWSDRLARIAQGWADRLRGEGCAMRHSGTAGIGENLAWAAGQHLSPAAVVAMWVEEARAFNPGNGTCAAGAVCGHYTQVVWRDTHLVGCGMASCGGSEVWVCNYSPPGNVERERPY
jgi:pathogenesis-related protein 1